MSELNVKNSSLPQSLLSSRIEELSALPVSWYVKRKKDQILYQLDLRTCHIENLSSQVGPLFQFSAADAFQSQTSVKQTGDEEKDLSSSVNPLKHPEFILKVNVSLNDMKELLLDDLLIFPEMRSLNASLNALTSFSGIAVATKLVSLDLSYNKIREVPNEALTACEQLQFLDLSVNKISSLAGFPMLPNLLKIRLRHNKLASLQGLHVLRSLKHLNVEQNKISSIIHLCPCLELTELNASENCLETVSDIIATLSPLIRMKQVYFAGNPVMSSVALAEIQAAVVRETSVVLMDSVNIRPIKSHFQSISAMQPPSPRDNLKVELKQSVREAMQESLVRKREDIHNSVHFLQSKILMLIEELEDYEDTVATDTEAWCRYIDTLTIEEARSLTISQIRSAALKEADGTVPTPLGASNNYSHIKMSKP